jgi:hypothetical protein
MAASNKLDKTIKGGSRRLQFSLSLKGKLRNTRLAASNALFPLYEAVVNSIHAIHEARDARQLSPTQGRIVITLERDRSQRVLRDSERTTQFHVNAPVQSVTVCDNGIGFNAVHFQSFQTSDTTQKLALGGRGIGRFLWIKAFERAEITSTYRHEDGTKRRRRFDFSLGGEGIERHEDAPAEEDATFETCVRLLNMEKTYAQHFPKHADVIARRIVEHCVEFFVVGQAPGMELVDPENGERTDLNELFAAEIRSKHEAEAFSVKGKPLQMTHVMLAAGHGGKHQVHFCANRRVVLSEPLERHVPNLPSTLLDPSEERPFVYAGYVAGTHLDETVSPDRSDFEMPHKRDEFASADPRQRAERRRELSLNFRRTRTPN